MRDEVYRPMRCGEFCGLLQCERGGDDGRVDRPRALRERSVDARGGGRFAARVEEFDVHGEVVGCDHIVHRRHFQRRLWCNAEDVVFAGRVMRVERRRSDVEMVDGVPAGKVDVKVVFGRDGRGGRHGVDRSARRALAFV